MSLYSCRVGMRNGRARLLLAAFLLICPLLLTSFVASAQDATPEATPAPEVTVEPIVTEVPVEATPEVTPEASPEATAVPQAAPLNVVGSGLALPLVNAVASASGITLNTQVTGTTSGITQFCTGAAAAVAVPRTLSAEEEALCAQNSVIFGEALIGHAIAALVVAPNAEFSQCFTSADLVTIFAPSATASNWNQVDPTNPDIALSVVLPSNTTQAYNAIDQVVEGDALRIDAPSLVDEAAVIDAVASTPGAIGVVSLEAALAAGDRVSIAQMNTAAAGCTSPNAEAVETGSYTAFQPIVVYYNVAGGAELITLLTYAASDEAVSAVTGAGFTAASADARAELTSALTSGTSGRVYSRVDTTFTIPPTVNGAVAIGGSAAGYSYVNNLSTAFTGTYTGVTTDIKVEGAAAGARRFCNGELDILVTYAPLTDEELAPCTANQVTPYPVSLGSEAVIIARNSADTFAQCLTTSQIASAFGDAAANTVMNWNQVDPAFPETPLFVFEAALGDSSVSLMMSLASGTSDPGRVDAQINADPLYRATAVTANSGVVAVLNWADWQVATAQYPDQLVPIAVDSGAGCVEPTVQTIADGSYALARPVTLLVNRASLNKPQVQSFLWYALSDENYLAIQLTGLVGLEFSDLEAHRTDLQNTFTAVAAEIAAAAEATPDPNATAEATAEATPGS